MKNINVLALLILIIFSFTINSVNATEDSSLSKDALSYTLSEKNILLWEEGKSGFTIHLTEKATEEFKNLTVENINKRLDLYIKDIKVSSPIIRLPISHGRMLISGIDEDIKKKIRLKLPETSTE